jgi:predicted dehydrogenase
LPHPTFDAILLTILYIQTTLIVLSQKGNAMTEPLHIALWGCGTMGNSLARALVATGEARLAAVHDLLPKAASGLAGTFGARVVESAEALLSMPRLDGVIIALPPYLHVPAAVQAAEAGVDIFLEKPMSTNASGCRRILAAAQAHGVKLMVGQVLRYYEPYRSILRWRAEGRFGTVFAASIWRMTNGKRWATPGTSGTSPGSPGTWRASREKSGGYILEIGAHELDMLRCLLGRPETVYATLLKVLPYEHEMEDHIAVHVRFAGGGAAVYEGGGGSAVGRYGFRLYMEGATLASDAAFDPQALQVHDTDGQLLGSLRSEFTAEHPVEAELRGWMAALRDEAPIPISGEEGLATVALADAAYLSAENRDVVRYET